MSNKNIRKAIIEIFIITFIFTIFWLYLFNTIANKKWNEKFIDYNASNYEIYCYDAWSTWTKNMPNSKYNEYKLCSYWNISFPYNYIETRSIKEVNNYLDSLTKEELHITLERLKYENEMENKRLLYIYNKK